MNRKFWMVGILLVAMTTFACEEGEDTTTDTIVEDVIQADNVQADTTEADTTEADTTAPDTTEPDTTEPDTTEPDTTEPDTTEPDTTELDTTVTDTTETDSGVPVEEFALLINHLEGEGGNYLNTTSPKILAAADVMSEGLENYVVLDIRTSDLYGPDAYGFFKKGANGVVDYDDGHIAGAIGVPLADLITYAKENLSTDDKILVVCHTGQAAGFGVLALNLLGYDAYSLKWGMSGWNPAFDLWSSGTSSAYAGQFTTSADSGKNSADDYPILDTGETSAAEILEARLTEVLAAPAFITAADLFADKDSYYIINYWPEAEYLDPGHIDGAHQYTPKTSMLTTAELATLPTDMPIVVYCYTGQNSAQVVAFLRVLGYDAYSLKFGTNGMIYESMTKSMWPGPATGPGNYTYEPVVERDEFGAVIDYLEGEGGNYLNTAAPKVVAAADVVSEGTENYVILDTRTTDKYGPDGDGNWQMVANGVPDYDDGHIEGAIMVAMADVITYAKANLTKEDKILVICWTGQVAGNATLALNLLGYDAYSLKWGMSGWNAVFDKWTSSTSNAYAGQFVTEADPGKDAAGDFPVLSTGAADAMGVLETRLSDVLANTRFISAANLFADKDSYYIVNYWSEEHYLTYGHIDGAHQYTPKASMLTTADLATLPTDMPIVVYCYTGQTSSQITAFLTAIGYDAYSLLAGTNGMIYDTTPNKWTGSGNFPFVPTSAE